MRTLSKLFMCECNERVYPISEACTHVMNPKCNHDGNEYYLSGYDEILEFLSEIQYYTTHVFGLRKDLIGSTFNKIQKKYNDNGAISFLEKYKEGYLSFLSYWMNATNGKYAIREENYFSSDYYTMDCTMQDMVNSSMFYCINNFIVELIVSKNVPLDRDKQYRSNLLDDCISILEFSIEESTSSFNTVKDLCEEYEKRLSSCTTLHTLLYDDDVCTHPGFAIILDDIRELMKILSSDHQYEYLHEDQQDDED